MAHDTLPKYLTHPESDAFSHHHDLLDTDPIVPIGNRQWKNLSDCTVDDLRHAAVEAKRLDFWARGGPGVGNGPILKTDGDETIDISRNLFCDGQV